MTLVQAATAFGNARTSGAQEKETDCKCVISHTRSAAPTAKRSASIKNLSLEVAVEIPEGQKDTWHHLECTHVRIIPELTDTVLFLPQLERKVGWQRQGLAGLGMNPHLQVCPPGRG